MCWVDTSWKGWRGVCVGEGRREKGGGRGGERDEESREYGALEREEEEEKRREVEVEREPRGKKITKTQRGKSQKRSVADSREGDKCTKRRVEVGS
jgi:hypothetical protein